MDEQQKFVSGWLLPRGINVVPQPVLVPTSARGISNIIGCDYVDAVRNSVSDGDDKVMLVGYVDDEALLKPHGLEDINHLAMFLLDTVNPLVGDCVVISGSNPDGYYDGEDYDLPSWLLEMSDEVVAGAADRYNKSMVTMMCLMQAIADGLIGEDEMQYALQDGESPDERFAELCGVALNYGAMLAEDDGAGVSDIVDGFTELLSGE